MALEFAFERCDECHEREAMIFCDIQRWCLECWNKHSEPYIDNYISLSRSQLGIQRLVQRSHGNLFGSWWEREKR